MLENIKRLVEWFRTLHGEERDIVILVGIIIGLVLITGYLVLTLSP